MKLAPSTKDVITTLNTEIATLALWDADGVAKQGIDTYDKFAEVFEKGLPELDGKSIIFETKSDGRFQITLRRNKGLSLSEKKILYKKALGYAFNVTGTVYLGDPGYIHDEDTGIKYNWLDTVTLPAGEYVVDTYSVLTKTDDGEPEFIQFILCIYDKALYPGAKKLQKFSKPFRLGYSPYSDEEIAEQEAKAMAQQKARKDYTLSLNDNLEAFEEEVASKLAPLLIADAPAGWKSLRLTVDVTRGSLGWETSATTFGGKELKQFSKSTTHANDIFWEYEGNDISSELLWHSFTVSVARKKPWGKGVVTHQTVKSHGKPHEFKP